MLCSGRVCNSSGAVGTAGSRSKEAESWCGVVRDLQGAVGFNIANASPAPAYTEQCGKIQRGRLTEVFQSGIKSCRAF